MLGRINLYDLFVCETNVLAVLCRPVFFLQDKQTFAQKFTHLRNGIGEAVRFYEKGVSVWRGISYCS